MVRIDFISNIGYYVIFNNTFKHGTIVDLSTGWILRWYRGIVQTVFGLEVQKLRFTDVRCGSVTVPVHGPLRF